MATMSLVLVNAAQEEDELEALIGFYLQLTGKEPTCEELAEVKDLLAG